MNRNKILSLILSFVMIGGLISAAPISVHASEINNTEVIQQSNNLYDLDESINNMVKYSGKIASVLDNLSTWSYVVEQAIYDQIAGALGGGTVARDVAWWVSKIVSWGVL